VRTPTSRPAGLLVNLSLAAGATALSLAVAVVAFAGLSAHRVASDVNFHDPNTRFDPQLGWAPIPGRSVVTWNNTRVSSNAAGFRSPEVDPSKRHLLIVGDSVVWGYKVGDDETVSRHLQDLEDGGRSDLQVLNLGVSGYGIDQYYLWLRRSLEKVPAVEAIVVVLTVVNDWKNTGANNAYGKSKPLFRIGPDGAMRNVNEQIGEYSLTNLTSQWTLPPWAKRSLARFYGRRETPEEERKAVVKALFAAMERLAAERDARLLFVLVPNVDDLGPRDSGELRLFRTLLAEGGHRVLDFKEFLAANEQLPRELYRDPVHLSPRGHRRLAEAIFGFLNRRAS
jgi:lysophospholipase L1-like esterase